MIGLARCFRAETSAAPGSGLYQADGVWAGPVRVT